MIKKCVICGKEFEAVRSTKLYCSNECMNTGRRQRYAKKKELGIGSGNIPRACVLCGEKFQPKTSFANNRMCCYNCMPEGIQLTRGMFLSKIKELRGGQCIRCGYNKCLKALEFHHLDPDKKDFTISNDYFRLDEVVMESKKCILICANCHRELHDSLWTIEELNLTDKEEIEPNAINS